MVLALTGSPGNEQHCCETISTLRLFRYRNNVAPAKCPVKPYSPSLVHHTLHCAHGFCISRKDRTGGGGWHHTQGDMHMVAARLSFEKAMVGSRWATYCPDRKDRLIKHYSHLVEGSGKEGCLGSERV